MCLFFDKSVREKVIEKAKKDHARRKAEKLSDQKLEGKLETTTAAAEEETKEETD